MKKRMFILLGVLFVLIAGFSVYLIGSGTTGGYSLYVHGRNYSADKIRYYGTNEEYSFDTKNFKGEKRIPIPRNIDTKKVYAQISNGNAVLLVDGHEYSLENGQNSISINDNVKKLEILGEFSGAFQFNSN